jgi:hypothetical protein
MKLLALGRVAPRGAAAPRRRLGRAPHQPDWAGWSDGMSFRLSFHPALLGLTGAHSLDDPPDLSCQDSTRQHALDGWPLSCKQPIPVRVRAPARRTALVRAMLGAVRGAVMVAVQPSCNPVGWGAPMMRADPDKREEVKRWGKQSWPSWA